MKNLLSTLILTFVSTMMFAQTWNQIQTGTTKNLNDIDFPTSLVGYIVGDSALILKTLDGGATWSEVTHTGINTFLVNYADVEFTDELTGVLVVEYGNAYRTLDGGLTWTYFGNQMSNQCFANTSFAFDSSNVFLGGAGCFQGALMDHYEGGAWSAATLNYFSWNTSEIIEQIDFTPNNTIGLAAMSSHRFFRSADAGMTWDTIPTGVDGVLTSVTMVDNLLGYAGYDANGGGFGILKTTDGGLTWSEDVNSATFYYPAYLSVVTAANGDVYSGARLDNMPNSPTGLIFETTDGTNWTYENVDFPIEAMASYGDDFTFGVGDSGYLVVNVLPSELAINDLNIDPQLTLYPNPAADQITIEKEVTESQVAMLLDMQGRKVQSIQLNDSLTTVDISNLQKGVYFLQVENAHQNSVIEVIKM